MLQTSGTSEMYEGKLNELEAQLNVNEQARNLIQSRTNSLLVLGKTTQAGQSLKGISKQSYYYQQRVNALQQVATDPGVLEQKALAYLQGLQGFDEALASSPLGSNDPTGMHNSQTAEDLERRGYQTKRQVQKQLTNQFGFKTPEQMKELNAKFKEGKNQLAQLAEGRKTISMAKQQLTSLGFRPNPMRGLPFVLRLERSFNWQVTRANRGQPARLEVLGQLGFRHTPGLTYHIVTGIHIGLGTDWQHIRLSNEGVRLGANADLKMLWGISGQAGFERVYKTYTQNTIVQSEQQVMPQVITENRRYRDIAYAGLQKTYKLSSKYYGTMLLAYDFLWKKGNATTPIIWRMGWRKK